MKNETLELFESEWTILQKVWQLEPCAAPTVQEALLNEKAWAYTTVKTMMDRMVKKGLLKPKKFAICISTTQRSPAPRPVKAKSPEPLKGPSTAPLLP